MVIRRSLGELGLEEQEVQAELPIPSSVSPNSAQHGALSCFLIILTVQYRPVGSLEVKYLCLSHIRDTE